ncbi:MAG: hypothetical protein ACQKBY_08605, partial [Verrucomicrobiales bacterium]
ERAEAVYRRALALHPYDETATSAMAPVLRARGQREEAEAWSKIAEERFGVLDRHLHNQWVRGQELLSQAVELMGTDALASERRMREAWEVHYAGRHGLRGEDREQWKRESGFMSGAFLCWEGGRLFKEGLAVWQKRQPERALALLEAARKRYQQGLRFWKDQPEGLFHEQNKALAERIAFLKGAQITPAELTEEEINEIALGEFSAKP